MTSPPVLHKNPTARARGRTQIFDNDDCSHYLYPHLKFHLPKTSLPNQRDPLAIFSSHIYTLASVSYGQDNARGGRPPIDGLEFILRTYVFDPPLHNFVRHIQTRPGQGQRRDLRWSKNLKLLLPTTVSLLLSIKIVKSKPISDSFCNDEVMLIPIHGTRAPVPINSVLENP